MNDQTDQQLLRDYGTHRSEAAFAELVRRHVDLVHSAAHRMVGDTHLARDITQATFVALAQHAARLTDRPALSGWLHTTARNLAVKTIRTDARRRVREQEAVVMNELLSSAPDVPWEQIAPHLDAAIGELSEPERDAVLLRYFEKKSAAEIGHTLGISAEAAQKRVSRAVERLREFFTKRGVTAGAGGLFVVISANAVQAAPVGLAVTISAAALAGTAVTTSTLIAATTKTIAMTTLQKTLITVTIAALAGAGIYEAHQAAQSRRQNQVLAGQITHLAADNQNLLNRPAMLGDSNKLPDEQFKELLRLRGEVGVLRRQTNELARLLTENERLRSPSADTSPTVGTATTAPVDALPKESWQFVGYADPESAFQSAAWAMSRSDSKAYLTSLAPEGPEFRDAQGKTEAELAERARKEMDNVTGFKIIEKEFTSDNEAILTVYASGVNQTAKFRLQRVGAEWKFTGPVKDSPPPNAR